ncbi:hypothetical protein LLH00_12750 [bacterium]|nr:hypothetical protein [bacterium]
MKKRLTFLSVTVLFLLAVACGGSDNPNSPDNENNLDGSLTMGGSRDNQTVSELTRNTVCQDIFSMVYRSYVQAARELMVDAEYGTKTVRVSADMYGYAVTPGFTELSGNTLDGVKFKFELAYNDFTDDGHLYLGGKLKFDGTMKFRGDYWVPKTLYISQSTDFAGDYKGSIQFNDLRLPLDSLGRLVAVTAEDTVLRQYPVDGSVNLKSGSNTFRYNPFYRVYRPTDDEDQTLLLE